jgi:hypothetical protein
MKNQNVLIAHPQDDNQLNTIKSFFQALKIKFEVVENMNQEDKELLNQFKAIEKMQENDKSVIKTLIDTCITKKKVQ